MAEVVARLPKAQRQKCRLDAWDKGLEWLIGVFLFGFPVGVPPRWLVCFN